jgi:hypothetical protein
MDTLFLTRVMLSFLIAGSWIAVATLLTERLGSKLGGLITNLPSNILISLIFIALTQGTQFVRQVVPGIPIGMLIDTFFLLVFIILLKYSLLLSLVGSLFTWFVLAIIAAIFKYDQLIPNIILYLLVSVATFITLEKAVTIPSKGKSSKKYSWKQILLRAIFAGLLVATVVLISRILNPFAVGIFATFPAVLLSTMVILAINQSREFARATGKVLVLSSTNIVVYSLGVYWSYPRYGIAKGTIISFLMAVIWVWGFRPFIHKWS